MPPTSHFPVWPKPARFSGIPLGPDLDEIAEALARQTGSRVVPSGAVAANRLGLSTQVPAKPAYLTDGRTRKVKIGATTFQLRHAAPKEFPVGCRTSAMVFQALRHLGQAAVDHQVVAQLRRALSAEQQQELLRDARYTTDWIASVVRQVVQDERELVNHG
jgi:transposase